MATLLIVDDDEATRHSLKRLLQTGGHTIHTAVDGLEAMLWQERLELSSQEQLDPTKQDRGHAYIRP